MGFFDMLGQQPPAPVTEAGIPAGIPQSPAVQPPPGVPPQPVMNPAALQPMPGPQQFQQGAPGSTPTPIVDQGKVDQWTALMNRITQPDVLGPLQTFLAAAAAPLQPGENFGARMGYANTLMQMHRSMLEENARLAPYLQRERDLKIQEMEGTIARNAAATKSSEVQTQRTQQQMDQDWEDRPGEIEAKQLGRKKTQQELEDAERKAQRDVKFGDKKEQSTLDTAEQTRKTSRAQELYYGRLPQAPAGRSGQDKKLAKSQLEDTYEIEIWAPYVEWAKKLDPGADTTFNAYLKENPTAAAMYKVWSKQFKEAGGSMVTRKESLEPAKGKGGKIDAQGNYVPNK